MNEESKEETEKEVFKIKEMDKETFKKLFFDNLHLSHIEVGDLSLSGSCDMFKLEKIANRLLKRHHKYLESFKEAKLRLAYC
jgi:hypothetical protein